MTKNLVLLILLLLLVLPAAGCAENVELHQLLRQLQSDEIPVRLQAARELEKLGMEAKAGLSEIAEALRSEDTDQVKLRLIGAIEKMETEAQDYAPVLVQALADPSLQVSFRARTALAKIIDDPDPLRNVVVPQLITSLRSDQPETRASAYLSLTRMPSETAASAQDLVGVAVDSSLDLAVRLSATSVLKSLGNRVNDTAPELVRQLSVKPDQVIIQANMLQVLAELAITDTASLGTLGQLIQDPGADLLIRLEAVTVLEKQGERAIAQLAAGLTVENAYVRRAAARSLGMVGKAASPAVPELIKVLIDEEENLITRKTAAWALAAIESDQISALEATLAAASDGDALTIFANRPDQAPNIWIKSVLTFAHNMLVFGRDNYGAEHTPLFVDGLNKATLEPVVWKFKGSEWIVSNLANQQNFMRTLVALSNLVHDPRYRQAAAEATKYMIDHFRSDSGLLYWGGHCFIDLNTDQYILGFDSTVHEFKNHFPFYELLWEVDPQAAEQFISAFWNAHITDWNILDMNRHGRFDKPLRTGISGPFAKNFQNGWENEFIGAKPFFVAEGLTFINCGSDLIYAGAMLYSFTGNEKPLQWAKTLAQQYVNARDPVTKLGAFQYSQSRNQAGPPDDPDNIQYAWQTSGDRAQRQFGHEFGDLALEGRFLHKEHDEIYGKNAIIQLQIAEMLGDAGQEFLSWTHEGLRAFAQYAYNMEESTVKPMWSDGTDLSGYQLKRSGYYGEQGTVLLPRRAGSIYLLSFALGYRLTQDPLLWKVARRVAMDHQLGDLGVQPGEEMDLNMATPNADPVALFSLLDIYRGTHETAYLELACRIGDNIIGQYFNEGFFAGKNNIYAPTDSEEAFALIALETAVRGDWDAVPRYNSGRGFIHGNYDGYGRTYDKVVFWQQAK